MPSARGHDTTYSWFMKDITYRSIPAVGTLLPGPVSLLHKSGIRCISFVYDRA